jgi:hypothetical protein
MAEERTPGFEEYLTECSEPEDLRARREEYSQAHLSTLRQTDLERLSATLMMVA